ncbi:MAG TPA: hypothetical protein VGN75_17280 [Kaistia sp.]|nr:hypothetical protein [Kaistia sp.]
MSTEQTPSTERPDLSRDEPEDLFIIAYDEYLAAVDRTDQLAKECERTGAAMPMAMRRNHRALIGLTTANGKSVPVYAASHDEIDQAADAMVEGSSGDAVTDLPVIEAFGKAAHAALDADDKQLREARVAYGLDDALERHLTSFDDIRQARERMLAIVPISPEGVVWLSKFLHSEATWGGDIETIAKAARNVATAMGRLVFNHDIHPTLH